MVGSIKVAYDSFVYTYTVKSCQITNEENSLGSIFFQLYRGRNSFKLASRWPWLDIELLNKPLRIYRCKKLIYMYFFLIFSSGFLHSDPQMTLNLIWWRSMDLGLEISDPKNLCMYFSGFFIGFFAVWPSNDLESDTMEVNGPRIWNQRPQKPTYVFFWFFLIGFFPKNTGIEAVKF